MPIVLAMNATLVPEGLPTNWWRAKPGWRNWWTMSLPQQALLAATVAVQKAEQDFDPERLKVAIADHQNKRDRATTFQTSLESEQKNLEKEGKRFKEWGSACLERDRVSAEIGRCEAAKAITELARKTLRDTAPSVAQHLCNRIAARAQSIFNQMNSEPIELVWDAERYILRVAPGERRFAMLSGGEQTKLALAMGEAVRIEFRDLREPKTEHPRLPRATPRPAAAGALFPGHLHGARATARALQDLAS